MNYELNDLAENADRHSEINKKKSRKVAWIGHVMRMDDKRAPNRVSEWKPIGTRIKGRPRKRRIFFFNLHFIYTACSITM
jgi:hypothetical protein